MQNPIKITKVKFLVDSKIFWLFYNYVLKPAMNNVQNNAVDAKDSCQL